MDSPSTDVLQHLLVNRVFGLVSFTFLYYDYVLTLSDELELYWPPRWTWPSAFFFLNRYLSIFGHVPVIMMDFWYAPVKACKTLQFYHQVFAIVSQVIVGIMLIMRTYALYGRARWILILLVSMALAIVSVALWAILGHQNVEEVHKYTGGTCITALSHTQGENLIICWGGMLVFDITVFALTLFKTLQMRDRSGTLFDVLLRDGTIYFGVLAFTTLSNILTFHLGAPLIKGVVTTFCNCISMSLITRLMLNVRNPDSVHESKGRSHYHCLTFFTRRCAVRAKPSETVPEGHAIVTTFLDMPEWATRNGTQMDDVERHELEMEYKPQSARDRIRWGATQ